MTVAPAGVLIKTAVTVPTPAIVLVLVLVLIFVVAKIMHCCVAVHAVQSTSTDVRVIVELTVINWTNCCRDSDVIAKDITEAG